jgi:hypothetical protein
MPIRSELTALAKELRHAHTRLLPLELAEQIQHTIVRIERMIGSAVLDATAVEGIKREGNRLLEECEALLRRQG